MNLDEIKRVLDSDAQQRKSSARNDDLFNKLVADVREYVSGIMDEYHYKMPASFLNDIVTDVIECSAFDEGYYDKGDINLAFQRVVAEKFGVEI